MKKTMVSLLMLAAMFMVASCGSKSNSGEATEATQEQVKEVTFTDPAFVYSEGLDLTSYFSAENLTKPGLWKDSDGFYHLSTNVKLKLLKKLNVVRDREDLIGEIYFKIKFCDENGSTIESGTQSKYIEDIVNMSEGTVIAVDVKSKGKSITENNGKELLEKVAKIELSTNTYNLKFAEATESNE